MLWVLALVVSVVSDLGHRGTPVFIHPDTVIHRISTVEGIVTLDLKFPGIYSESVLSDFDGINELVRNELYGIYRTRVDSNDLIGCRGPIRVLLNKQRVSTFQPVLTLPCDLVDIVRSKLTTMFQKIQSLILQRIMAREDEIEGFYSHVFEMLYARSQGDRAGLHDKAHDASIRWIENGVIFKQGFPALELSLEYPRMSQSVSLVHLGMYFDWSVLNSAVSERTRSEPIPDSEHHDVVNRKPMTARKSYGRGTKVYQISFDSHGSITIACILGEFRGYLRVVARDKHHSRLAGIDTPGLIIWKGVARLCENMGSAVAPSSEISARGR